MDVGAAIVIAIGVLATGAFMAMADRFPKLTMVLAIGGGIALAVALVVSVIAVPWLSLSLLGFFMLGNLAHAHAGTTSNFSPRPANRRAISVWAEEIRTLVGLGWDYRGTWLLDGGQTQPVWTVVERPTDGTHVGMFGTAAKGGVITFETLLDEGRGLLVTMPRPASSLRPPWMFRQEIKGASLVEMVQHHDDALFYLQAHGIAPGTVMPSAPLDFDRFTNSKLRRHLKRRWWLWAIRPIALRFGPRTTRLLHEQVSIGRQVDQYRKAIESESRFAGGDPSLR